jgi:hypothetical protein
MEAEAAGRFSGARKDQSHRRPRGAACRSATAAGIAGTEVELFVVPVIFAVLGYVVGRWWMVDAAVATCVGVAVFLVVNNGWYGHGWGDFGVALNVLAGCLTVLLAAVGVAAARARG